MKNDTNPIIYICGLLVSVFVAVMLTCNYFTDRQILPQSDTITVSDTIYKTDSVLLIKPQPYTVRIKEIITDTLYSTDSVKTSVNVPISVYQFKGDKFTTDKDSVFYTALISGYRVSLDSLSILTKTHSVNTHTEITNTILKKKRFTYGLQVGVGVGVIKQTPDIYVGFGIQYNF